MPLRRQILRLPPLARRDAEIRRLKRRVEKLQLALADEKAKPPPPPPPPPPPRYRPKVASWHMRVMEQQRVQRAVAALPGSTDHPRRNLLLKLQNYEIARSYGVSTPQVLGVWSTVEEIDWDALPYEFVLKSNGGSTGRGVLPLQRTPSGFELIDGSGQYTRESIVEHYATARGARAPFFAETVLPGAHERLPDDIKIYSYYGEVVFVLVRRMPVHADTSQSKVRMLGPDGNDLGEVLEGRTHDLSVAVPRHLEHMVEVASVLSRAVPVPFVRVDLYDLPEGIALGELTPLPGDSQTFTRDWDRDLGDRYDRAEARLQLDLTGGRPFRILHGPHDRRLTTPMAPTTTVAALPTW